MLPFRLFYVSISTPDIDRAVKWYQEKLGYQIFTRKDFPDFGTRIAVLELDDFRLELIEQNGSVPISPPRNDPPAHTNIQGISQFALLVDNLDAKIAELKSKGIETLWVKRVDYDLQLSFQFIKDCDGNLIQFVELMPEAIKHLNEISRRHC
ncbi:MAG: VOC family protein [Chlorogloeopsis fritschii C42_A2020_084]|nr:VOC family protein [Chlorogloeopsis fritschii C42_A2020_084]